MYTHIKQLLLGAGERQRKSRKSSFCRVQSRHDGDWIYRYISRHLPGKARGLMRRGMMEFANHPALHFSLPWFSIPPSACSSKTSSSSLSTRSLPLRAIPPSRRDPRSRLRHSVPFTLFISLLDISFCFLCLPIWRHISNVTSVPLQRRAIISLFFPLYLFIRLPPPSPHAVLFYHSTSEFRVGYPPSTSPPPPLRDTFFNRSRYSRLVRDLREPRVSHPRNRRALASLLTPAVLIKSWRARLTAPSTTIDQRSPVASPRQLPTNSSRVMRNK